MSSLDLRVNTFIALGDKIKNLSEQGISSLANQAFINNRWFSEESVVRAFEGIAHMLEPEKVRRWISEYHFEDVTPKQVGIVMAGNIPMVGFHDLMCVLLSGHTAAIKMSSQDEVLIKNVLEWISEINPDMKRQIDIREQLKGIDAVIATGSDNTARYFEYYFKHIPNIIRKNRTSVAVLEGNESTEDIKNLGHDLFDYYGLGCRNVSKIFYPASMDFTKVLDNLQGFDDILQLNKYQNNYDYHKSILLVNRDEHLDTGYALFQPSEGLVSPTSVTYIQTYNSLSDTVEYIRQNSTKIQCVVSKADIPGAIHYGTAQKPEVWDYADNVDTLKFLSSL